MVTKLIPEIIPCFGIPLWTESDQGTHFSRKTNHLIIRIKIKNLISLKFHTLRQPQLSGQRKPKHLERKRNLRKICQETSLKWPEPWPWPL